MSEAWIPAIATMAGVFATIVGAVLTYLSARAKARSEAAVHKAEQRMAQDRTDNELTNSNIETAMQLLNQLRSEYELQGKEFALYKEQTRQEIVGLRKEIKDVRGRVRELESENDYLRTELEKCAKKEN